MAAGDIYEVGSEIAVELTKLISDP